LKEAESPGRIQSAYSAERISRQTLILATSRMYKVKRTDPCIIMHIKETPRSQNVDAEADSRNLKCAAVSSSTIVLAAA
jgi:hypothetical protein